MPGYRSIDHPRFTRVSATHYLLKDPNNALSSTLRLHVGQIADFLKFDEKIRTPGPRGGARSLTSMPLGFAEFAEIWNSGVRDGDPRRISKVFLAEESGDHLRVFEASSNPIPITDFFITAEQAGLGPDVRNNPTSIQNEIMQEFAIMMMYKRRNQRRHGYEDRREKRLRAFTEGPASRSASDRPVIPGHPHFNSRQPRTASSSASAASLFPEFEFQPEA